MQLRFEAAVEKGRVGAPARRDWRLADHPPITPRGETHSSVSVARRPRRGAEDSGRGARATLFNLRFIRQLH